MLMKSKKRAGGTFYWKKSYHKPKRQSNSEHGPERTFYVWEVPTDSNAITTDITVKAFVMDMSSVSCSLEWKSARSYRRNSPVSGRAGRNRQPKCPTWTESLYRENMAFPG